MENLEGTNLPANNSERNPVERNEIPATERELIASAFSGPLPPPQILAEYEEILPGSAERIFSSFESQIDHRQSLEREVISSDIKRAGRGQSLAFIIVVIGMVGGFYLIASGFSVGGFVAMLVPLGTVAGAFILDRVKNDQKTNFKSEQESDEE